jgi:hypothetical protein
MFDLRNEPEIFLSDKGKPQILNGHSYVENVFLAIGFASRCWTKKGSKEVFDTDQAIRIANELCAYIRLLKQPTNNLEYLEYKYGKYNENRSSH